MSQSRSGLPRAGARGRFGEVRAKQLRKNASQRQCLCDAAERRHMMREDDEDRACRGGDHEAFAGVVCCRAAYGIGCGRLRQGTWCSECRPRSSVRHSIHHLAAGRPSWVGSCPSPSLCGAGCLRQRILRLRPLDRGAKDGLSLPIRRLWILTSRGRRSEVAVSHDAGGGAHQTRRRHRRRRPAIPIPVQRFRSSNHIDIINQPRPEERALARVSKDRHRRDRAGVHPSRRRATHGSSG
jgi:hypothetical protein